MDMGNQIFRANMMMDDEIGEIIAIGAKMGLKIID